MGHLAMGAAESEETTGILPQYEFFTGESGDYRSGCIPPLYQWDKKLPMSSRMVLQSCLFQQPNSFQLIAESF